MNATVGATVGTYNDNVAAIATAPALNALFSSLQILVVHTRDTYKHNQHS